MKFLIQDVSIKDIKIITPQPFKDERGFFMEVFNKTDFEAAGIPTNFVQMNHSRSYKNVLRGLHFQWDPPMGKLMRVTRGYAYLIAVDIRQHSPTYGQYYGDHFSEYNKKMIWAPAGFARGIYAIEEDTEVQYLVTGEYNSENEGAIKWDDPDLNIQWPRKGKVSISLKDQNAMTFKEWTTSADAYKLNYYCNFI